MTLDKATSAAAIDSLAAIQRFIDARGQTLMALVLVVLGIVLVVDAALWLSGITALPLQGAHPASRLFPG